MNHRASGPDPDERAQLVEQVAKIITGRNVDGTEDHETWKLWTAPAEQIIDLLRPDNSEARDLLRDVVMDYGDHCDPVTAPCSCSMARAARFLEGKP